MKKNKKNKRRNVVVQNMIERSQKAGPHKDKRKESSKKSCRKKIDKKNIEE